MRLNKHQVEALTPQMLKEASGTSLGKDILEDLLECKKIEEELGIDLITLFKALKNGFWYGKEGHSLHTNLCLNVDKEWVIGCWLKKYECVYCRLKDYGKEWALSKEELENE